MIRIFRTVDCNQSQHFTGYVTAYRESLSDLDPVRRALSEENYLRMREMVALEKIKTSVKNRVQKELTENTSKVMFIQNGVMFSKPQVGTNYKGLIIGLCKAKANLLKFRLKSVLSKVKMSKLSFKAKT